MAVAVTKTSMVGSCPGLMTKTSKLADEFKHKSVYDALVAGGAGVCLTAAVEIDNATREGGGLSVIEQVEIIEIAPASGIPKQLDTELRFSKVALPALGVDVAFGTVDAAGQEELFGPIKITTEDYEILESPDVAVATIKGINLEFKTTGQTGASDSSQMIYMAHVANEPTPYPDGTIIIILIKFRKL